MRVVVGNEWRESRVFENELTIDYFLVFATKRSNEVLNRYFLISLNII